MTEPKDPVPSNSDQKAIDLKGALFELNGFASKRELEIGYILVDILYETELPEKGFPLTKVTSTSNDSLVEKAGVLNRIEELRLMMIPSQLKGHDQVDLKDIRTQEEWPGVNMIHMWMTTLSYMNTVIAMQNIDSNNELEEMEPSPGEVISAMMHELWLCTTEGNDRKFLRNSESFERDKKTPETFMRESGTEGVNATRRISCAEMKYILNTIKDVYQKK